MNNDPVNHPPHYTQHSSSVECYEISQHLSAAVAQAFQYIWRAEDKGNAAEDYKKAVWWLEREIQRLEPLMRATKKVIDSESDWKAHLYRQMITGPGRLWYVIDALKERIAGLESTDNEEVLPND